MPKLCFGCMRQKENSPVCEHCGYDETKENLPHQLPVGTLLQNQYLVGKVLGQGGFGITYMGWDQHLSIPVAIKEYFPGGVVQRHTQLSTKVSCINGEAPEMFAKHRERFLKEARTLAQLSRIPEIVQIKSFFGYNDTAYIVMEYVQGKTLKAHLRQLGRPMTEKEVLDIMEPVLKALQKVHDHGLIHRDISPDNIMLPVGGGVKLIDFGTVRYLDDSGKSKSTEAVLKPGFAPMEQYITHGNLGAWTDIYALCATFHYLLTGKVPEEAMCRVDGDGTLPLLRNREDLFIRLITALEKGMAVRITDRIQSIEALYQLLYSQKPLQKDSPVKPVSKPQRKTRNRIVPVLLLVTALAAAGILAGKFHQTHSDDSPPATDSGYTSGPQAAAPATEESRYQEAAALAERGRYAQAAILYANLGDYLDSRARAFEMWALVPNRTMLSFYDYYDASSGRYYDMLHAIREDGSIAVDSTFPDVLSETMLQDYPTANYEGIVSIHGVIGLRYDGTLAVPEGIPKYQPLTVWSGITALAAYEFYDNAFEYYLYAGLKTDGTLVILCSHPVSGPDPEDWSGIQAIACERELIVGLKEDGTVIAAGSNAPAPESLNSWQNITAIAVGNGQVFGLCADGTVVGAGTNENNALTLVSGEDWNDMIALADGPYGIRSDGCILSGCIEDVSGKGNVSGWDALAAVTCNQWQAVGLRKDGTLLFTADGWGFYTNARSWDDILRPDQIIADPQVQYGYAEAWVQEGQYARAAVAFGKLGSYRDSRERSIELWRRITPHETVAAGDGCSAVILQDGTVYSPAVRIPQQYAVSSWKDIVCVSAGSSHTVGLKADGTVVSTSAKAAGNCPDWTDMLAIDASAGNTLGLRKDGTVAATGDNESGQCQVSGWTDIVAISSSSHSVGLKMDGTVVAVGSNQNGQCDVSHWKDIIAISSASYDQTGLTVGLKTDGTIVVAGGFDTLQADISGWKDIVAVEAAVNEKGAFLVGLKADGNVVAAGENHLGQCNVSGWSDIVSIHASGHYVIGLKSDGTLITSGRGSNGETRRDQPTNILLP